MYTKKQLLALVVVALILGSSIGYGFGFTKGSLKSMALGLSFAKQFMNIEFDEEAIASGIFAYENRINDCFTSRNLTNDN